MTRTLPRRALVPRLRLHHRYRPLRRRPRRLRVRPRWGLASRSPIRPVLVVRRVHPLLTLWRPVRPPRVFRPARRHLRLLPVRMASRRLHPLLTRRPASSRIPASYSRLRRKHPMKCQRRSRQAWASSIIRGSVAGRIAPAMIRTRLHSHRVVMRPVLTCRAFSWLKNEQE